MQSLVISVRLDLIPGRREGSCNFNIAQLPKFPLRVSNRCKYYFYFHNKPPTKCSLGQNVSIGFIIICYKLQSPYNILLERLPAGPVLLYSLDYITEERYTDRDTCGRERKKE
jgi:hypothetical protein